MIGQYPNLPTGCEPTAAAMVLQYHGANVTVGDFAGKWLKCSSRFYWKDGKRYGPDLHEIFAGNPFSEASYGCYAGPIVQAVNTHGQDFTARKITGQTLAQLCQEYIDMDKPLAVWVDGEHCMVLVGHNDKEYIFNDPRAGRRVSYRRSLAEQRFAQMGSQAVYIDKKTN